MKLARFHLSTLLLLCLCAGAVIGLYLDRAYWRLEKTFTVEGSLGPPGISIAAEYPWIYHSNAVFEKEFAPIPISDSKQEFIKIDSARKRIGIYLVPKGIVEADDKYLKSELQLDGTPYWFMYSPDQERLAVNADQQIKIYRRTRGYGMLGLIKLPLFWVAALSLLFLALIFLRWLRTTLSDFRARKTGPEPSTA